MSSNLMRKLCMPTLTSKFIGSVTGDLRQKRTRRKWRDFLLLLDIDKITNGSHDCYNGVPVPAIEMEISKGNPVITPLCSRMIAKLQSPRQDVEWPNSFLHHCMDCLVKWEGHKKIFIKWYNTTMMYCVENSKKRSFQVFNVGLA